MIVKNFSIAQQDEKIRMAHAAGLYLFSFPRYRQGNVRNRVKFLIPGPLKICEKIDCSVRAWENSVLRNRTRKLEWRKPQVCISFRFRDIEKGTFGIVWNF